MPPEATVAAASDQADNTAVAGAVDDTTPDGTAGGEAQTGAAADNSAVDEGENDAIELLGADGYGKVKDNPKALAKALNRAFTQKSQANAVAIQFVKDLETRPVEVIKALAKQAGMDLGGTVAPKKNEAFEALSEAFGPEVAADIMPAFGKVVEQMMEARLGPIRQAQDRVAAETAEARSQAVMDSFGAKHPDWSKHEKAMMEIAKRVAPTPGTTELQHLEDLYYLATRDSKETERVQGVVDRMGKSVKATDVGAVPASRVDPTAVRPNSISEAFQLAKRGVRVQ